MKYNTTLPEEMYILHKNTLSILNTIETIERADNEPKGLVNIMCFMTGTTIIMFFTGNIFLVSTMLILYQIMLIIGICWALYIDTRFTLLKRKYPMEFIVWNPNKYILTTKYKVKEYDDLDDNDRIIDIDMEKLKNKNPEIFRQLELRNKGYN